jgi:hypothetical protein
MQASCPTSRFEFAPHLDELIGDRVAYWSGGSVAARVLVGRLQRLETHGRNQCRPAGARHPPIRACRPAAGGVAVSQKTSWLSHREVTHALPALVDASS